MRNVYLLVFLSLIFTKTQGQISSKPTPKDQVLTYLQNSNEKSSVAPWFKSAEVTSVYYDKNIEAQYAYYRQRVNGLPVFNAFAGSVIKKGEVAHFWETFHKEKPKNPAHALSYKEALSQYLLDFGYANAIQLSPRDEAYSFFDKLIAEKAISIKKGYYKMNEVLVPTYEVEHVYPNRSHWYLIQIDATTGKELSRLDYTLSCSFDHIESHAHGSSIETRSMPEIQNITGEATQSATGTYQVFPYPVESPNHGARALVSDADDEEASPYGWHDVNADDDAEFTITRGNNVYASEDKNADNVPGNSPDGGANLNFQAPFDVNQSAQLYIDAAVINLFYWNNIMHDVFWHYGFDEPSGNFQQNNYGNGGVAGDFVLADAQDGSGTNNANFQTPVDGNSGRMQMFLWGVSSASDYMQVNSPASLFGKVYAVQAQQGVSKQLTSTPITGDVVLAEDGTGNNEGCNAYTNAADVNGKIAVVDRGSCQFTTKMQNALNAGALAVIVINDNNTNPIAMGGSVSVDIPAVMISNNLGNLLKQRMESQTIEVSLYDSSNVIDPNARDSDFDNGVIAHEYTHGISIRLAGGPANSSCLNNIEQMGEGWSDFLALVMTHQPDDKPEDARGIGTYAAGQVPTGRGIRNYPYSVDMNRNPVTYDYIKSNDFTVPHGVGSVWCSMLWDLYWNMIEKHGYDQDVYKGTGGNNMTMHLVLQGLKLQKCNPGFIDGRDAILEADELLYEGENKKLIWETFARRGLGFSADQGSSNNKFDGVEAFDIPDIFGSLQVEKSGPELAEVGDTLYYSIKVKNIGEDPIDNIFVSDTALGGGFMVSTSNACDFAFRGNIASLDIPRLEAGDSLECTYGFKTDNSLKSSRYFYDDVEGDSALWFVTNGTGDEEFVKSTEHSTSGDSSYFIASATTRTDTRLKRELNLVNAKTPYLVFKHRYNTEFSGDGCVVEVNAIGIWEDLGSKMLVNGYSGSITRSAASSLAGRSAFTGDSKGWKTTIVDLSKYTGQVIDLRFRFATDEGTAVEGWFIDDVEVYYELALIENSAFVSAPDKNTDKSSVLTLLLPTSDTVDVIPGFKERLEVFPNPTTDVLRIRFTSPNVRTAKYQIADMSGKIVASGQIEANVEHDVDVRHLANGYYVVELQDGLTLRQTKVLKVSR